MMIAYALEVVKRHSGQPYIGHTEDQVAVDDFTETTAGTTSELSDRIWCERFRMFRALCMKWLGERKGLGHFHSICLGKV